MPYDSSLLILLLNSADHFYCEKITQHLLELLQQQAELILQRLTMKIVREKYEPI
jgi:hypothetical protein